MKQVYSKERASGIFWRKVIKRENDQCWEWTGRMANGYGQTWFNGKNVRAHRFAWFISYGYMPSSKMHVCHKCDNRKCCNPKHLFVGTPTENRLDCIMKERGWKKLSPWDVLEIRRKYLSGLYTYRQLANEFGVYHTMIGNIIRMQQRVVV